MAGSTGGAPLEFKNFQPPNVSSVNDLACVTHFIVTMNTFTYSFMEVSGLEINTNFDCIPEGGVNDHGVFVGMPNTGQKSLTFRRGMLIKGSALATNTLKAGVANIPIAATRKASLMAINATSAVASLESGPTPGTIEVFSRNKLVAIFRFMSNGITNWSINDLDAKSGDLLIETIQISHTGLIRVPVFNYSSGKSWLDALALNQVNGLVNSVSNITQTVPALLGIKKNNNNDNNVENLDHEEASEVETAKEDLKKIEKEIEKKKQDVNNAEKDLEEAEKN